MAKYLLDTCIWRDFYEDRTGIKGRPLGKYASRLFAKIIDNKDTLYFSDILIRELMIEYDENQISEMLNVLFLSRILEKVGITEEEYNRSQLIAVERKIPRNDALHAILAAKVGATLISQDKHMHKVQDIVEVKKPEDII